MLDKGRAALAGTAGDYKFACALDLQLLQFAGIDPEALKAELQAGRSDAEILAWWRARAARAPTEPAIAAWSVHQDQRAPADPESRAFFNQVHRQVAPHRDDVVTWFDLLDLDDYASFGGRP
jgi:hypothetical protein